MIFIYSYIFWKYITNFKKFGRIIYAKCDFENCKFISLNSHASRDFNENLQVTYPSKYMFLVNLLFMDSVNGIHHLMKSVTLLGLVVSKGLMTFLHHRLIWKLYPFVLLGNSLTHIMVRGLSKTFKSFRKIGFKTYTKERNDETNIRHVSKKETCFSL